MTAIFNLLGVLAIPLALLNMFGGIVAGIWLAVLGEWGVIGWGLLFLVVSTFGIGIAMMPGLIFVIPTAYFGERGQLLPMGFFALLHNLYIVAIMIAWCLFVLVFFMNKVETAASMTPVLIWSYGSATGPFAHMASKEIGDGPNASVLSALMVQIGYLIVVMALFLISGLTLLTAAKILAAVMSISLVLQTVMAIELFKAGLFERRSG